MNISQQKYKLSSVAALQQTYFLFSFKWMSHFSELFGAPWTSTFWQLSTPSPDTKQLQLTWCYSITD